MPPSARRFRTWCPPGRFAAACPWQRGREKADHACRRDHRAERGGIDHRGNAGALAQGRWVRRSRPGDPLFELETDKASSVVPAPAAGVLKIGVAEGQTVAIGATVGTIDPAEHPSRPRHRRAGVADKEDRRPEATVAVASAAGCRGGGDPAVPLSPAVRRLVAEEGVDVAGVTATGPGGRITKGDV